MWLQLTVYPQGQEPLLVMVTAPRPVPGTEQTLNTHLWHDPTLTPPLKGWTQGRSRPLTIPPFCNPSPPYTSYAAATLHLSRVVLGETSSLSGHLGGWREMMAELGN